jgi:hypothetical protein
LSVSTWTKCRSTRKFAHTDKKRRMDQPTSPTAGEASGQQLNRMVSVRFMALGAVRASGAPGAGRCPAAVSFVVPVGPLAASSRLTDRRKPSTSRRRSSASRRHPRVSQSRSVGDDYPRSGLLGSPPGTRGWRGKVYHPLPCDRDGPRAEEGMPTSRPPLVKPLSLLP